jgi:hypothetical protein
MADTVRVDAEGAVMRWLRLYDDVLDDPKVQRLSPDLFKHWINLLCLANKGSPRGRIANRLSDLAFSLRVPVEELERILPDLVNAGLLEFEDDSTFLVPHGWGARQFKSDTSTRPAAHEWRVLRDAVFERGDYTCTYCGTRGVRLECDHVIPVARGGTHDESNLVTACFTCNRSKRDKTPDEWRPTCNG